MTEQEVNNLIDSKIGKTKMSQLPEATQTSGLYSIGYNGNQSVKYKANLLQGDPLTVRKTYQTEALALADKNPIDTTTSLPLKIGQFVSIVADTTTAKNGIYRISSISGDGTMSLELQGKLGDLSDYLTISEDGTVKKDGVGVTINTDSIAYNDVILTEQLKKLGFSRKAIVSSIYDSYIIGGWTGAITGDFIGGRVKVYECVEGETIRVVGEIKGSMSAYAFYEDIECTLVVGVGESVTGTTWINIQTTVPEGANYIGLYEKYSSNNYHVYKPEALEVTVSNLLEKQEKYKVFQKKEDIFTDIGKTLILKNGILQASNSYNVKVYPVEGGEVVRVKAFQRFGNIALVAFYKDALCTQLASIGRILDVDNPLVDDYFTAPYNARYIALCEAPLETHYIDLFRAFYPNEAIGSISDKLADLEAVDTAEFSERTWDLDGRFLGNKSKNLFDNTRKAFNGEKVFLSPLGVVTPTGYSTFISHLIPLKGGATHLTLSSIDGLFSNTTGYRFMNSDGDVILVAPMENSVDFFTISIPVGAALFQFSTSRLRTQVEYGSVRTSYESYGGIIISDDTTIVLPEKIYVSNNRDICLYLPNINSSSVYENKVISIEGTPLANVNNFASFGKITKDVTANVYIHNNNRRALLDSFDIKAVDPSINVGKSPNIMCVGDSYTDIGFWMKSLRENLVEDGVAPNFIGAMHTKNDWAVRSENQSGGKLYDSFMKKIDGYEYYLIDVTGITNKEMSTNWNNFPTFSANGYVWTVWGYDLDENGDGKMRVFSYYGGATLPTSGVLIKRSGIADDTINFTNPIPVNKNPFWNLETDKLDVAQYLNIWNFETPDVLILQFMWNDLPVWVDNIKLDTLVDNIGIFIDAFKEVNPLIKTIFSIQPSAPMNASNSDVDGRKNTVLRLANSLNSKYNASNDVLICPSFAFVDPIMGFGSEDVVISSRIPLHTLSLSEDDIHPREGGMLQIGDAITPYVHKLI